MLCNPHGDFGVNGYPLPMWVMNAIVYLLSSMFVPRFWMSPVCSRTSMFHSKSGLLAFQFQKVFEWSGFFSIDSELKLKRTDQSTKVGSYAAIVAHLPLESPSVIFLKRPLFPEDDFHPSAGSYRRLDCLCFPAVISYYSLENGTKLATTWWSLKATLCTNLRCLILDQQICGRLPYALAACKT